MRDMRWFKNRVTTVALSAALAGFMTAALVSGCGGVIDDGSPGIVEPSITLKANSDIAAVVDSPTLRANSRDTLQVQATVRGLSSQVGFFLPANYGTFQGGTVTNGLTYYLADRNGVATATIVSGAATGKTEVIAKSLDKSAVLPVTFDLATLLVLPRSVSLPTVPGASARFRAFGGLPPLQWTVSAPYMDYRVIDDYTIEVYIVSVSSIDAATLGATINVVDAEGQSTTTTTAATIAIDVSTGYSCAAGTVTVTADAVGAQWGSTEQVSVSDANNLEGSATVIASYSDGSPTETLTLPLVYNNLPGVFQTSHILGCNGTCAGVTITYTYVDNVGAACVPAAVTATQAGA